MSLGQVLVIEDPFQLLLHGVSEIKTVQSLLVILE